MQIKVDYDICESNALCMEAAPDIFDLDDDDYLLVLDENPDESHRAKVEEAAARCPRAAITIVD